MRYSLYMLLILILFLSCNYSQDDSENIVETETSFLNPRGAEISMPVNELEELLRNVETSTNQSNIINYQDNYSKDYEYVIGSKTCSRDFEMETMKNVFNSGAQLLMDFSEGEWKKISNYNGKEWDICWETIRIVNKTLIMNGKTMESDDHYRIVVALIEDSGTKKYKITKVIHIRDADYNNILSEWAK